MPISSSTNARDTAPKGALSANVWRKYLLKMSSVKTTSFLLHSLQRDLSSAVLSLEGHSPRGTDCILERKRSTKSPRREFHACLLQECPTWDTVEQLEISQGYFRLSAFWFQGGCAEPPLWVEARPTPKHADAGRQTVICSRDSPLHLPLFAPKGTIHSEEAGVLLM